MARRHLFYSLFAIVLIVASAGIPVESRGAAALQDQGQEKKLSAGRNVNMVSGTTLPNGDPWLQRQNEPSMAVSTRNPLHILAGSNDYRTVDMLIENEQLPGREGKTAAAPDAWLGLYKSVDGGQSWASTLLPGFPQDLSSQGVASPLKYNTAKKKGFTAAADPVVRSGPSGMFYYSGIAFNRTKIPGWINGSVFISRFIDNNNAESGDAIQYIDTQIIADDNKLAAVFVDKPWIAVDAPLPGASMMTINGQQVPRHNVYIAYSVFIELAKTQTSSIIFRRSPDCGKTWGLPHILSLGSNLNQGATIAIDPRDNGIVYVAWRRFDAKNQTSAIMVARSKTKGILFENAKVVATFPSTQGPFDQPSTTVSEFPFGSFRTNSYPTMAVDDKGIVYLAWAQRGYGPTRESRIVLATSKDGLSWTPRAPIDSLLSVQGHQFMPSLAFAAGKLTMAWYDQRDDVSGVVSGFDDWISDTPLRPFRHTIDVRAAQSDTVDFPNLHWETAQISRYHFTLEEDSDNRGAYKAFQSQWNPPNYPLFTSGTLPFHGDYLDLAPSPMFVRSQDGRWRFNTAASDNALFHVTWTDNRDVRPPFDGNWANYAPPTSTQLEKYITPGRPVCFGGQQPGMRNQNVYTAQLFSGIEVGSPTNAKALDLDVPRAFAVFVKNNTWTMRSFRLTIAAQPPGGQASFLQFDPLEYLDVTIAPYSTISRQVFISSTNHSASVTVRIEEINMPEGSVLSDGMTGSVLLNGDPTSSGVVGGEETHQPQIENPHIRNWSVNAVAVNPEIDNEDIVNTDIVNPNIVDLGATNPAIVNPNVVNPSLFNPHIRNTDYLNPNIVNPHIRNPHIRNESPEDLSITDVEWPVKNIGNTASSFSFTLIAKEALPEGLYAQLIVYKVHYTPAVAGGALAGNMNISGCELKQEPHHEVLLNVVNPDIVNPHIRNPNLLNPHIRNAAIENATFVLGPGEEAIVNLRIIESHEAQMTRAMATFDGFELPVEIGSFIESVGAAVTAQSVDSEDAAQGIEEPKTDATTLVITTSSLPPGLLNESYPSSPNPLEAAQLQAAGGTGSYSWWVNPDELPLGLSLNAASGQISGVPLRVTGTYPRVYSFTVQVMDSGSPQQSANQSFSIAIEDRDPVEPPPLLSITTPSPLPVGTEGTPYGTALNAVGGVWPYTWTRVPGFVLPPGLNMDELGTIGGTPSLAGTFEFSVRVTDSASPAQFKEKAYSLTIRAADAPTFSISGRVTLGAGGASLPGVLMRGLPSAPTTDASGSYSDTVPAGWSGTAIPFKAGYYFVPAEISYTDVQSHRLGQNYIAYLVTLDHFDISSIGNAIAGAPFPVTIAAKDDRGETVTTYTDANMLSDTTGTISPTMTAPFTNGVWTGQVAIMKTAQGVVIQTSGGGRMSQSNAFNVALGSPSAIRIEDAPDGTGTEVVTKTLGPGHALTVYAVSRDLGNNFVANVAVVWSLIDKTLGIVDGDLVPAGNNLSAVFTAHAAGAARIRAEHASLGADTTGTITVMEAMVDDAYENNDDRAHAAPISLGTYTNLVLMDEDWFKITVLPADAGKDLMIHLKGVSYPDPDIRKDLDMLVLDGSGRLMGYNISGGDDEYAFIPEVAAGDYTIGLTYIPVEGVVYSLTAEVGTNFGIGYIEGRVTDKNGYGLENILVELYGDPFNWDISRPMTTTGANGFYKIGFFPGPYTVLFNIFNPDWRDPLVPDVNYLGETYHGNEVVTLVAGATVPGINTQLEPGGAITGRVTDSSGNGLNLAAVYVHAGDATRVAAGYADANGNYVVDRLYTGNYKVRARQDAIYGLEWYGNAPSLADGLPVPVMGGQWTSGIDVELGPDMAYVQGRVTDSLGNPISGVLVSAFDEAGINVAGANTDEAGNYRIPRLSTGEVRIYFDAAPAQGNYVSKYFPNEDLLTGAIPVPVKAGETTSGIDAQLSDGGTISGRVTGAPGTGIPGISIRCFDTNGDRYFGTTTDATGNYTLAHVWPDDYKVLFRPETGSSAAEWYSDWSSSSGARVITVGAGQVITGIDAQLAAQGGSISGRVTSESPIRNMRVLAYDGTRGTLGAHISSTATDAAGNYRIPRLPGTEYKVYFDADRNFLGYNSEYYAGKGTFGQADLVPIILGEETENISAIPIARTSLDITTTSLPEGKQSTFYSASLEAFGGRPFYFWSVESGALPNGLTLNGKGEIRGNPTAAGTFNFTVRVTDSTRPQQSEPQALTIIIGAYTGTGYIVSGKVLAGGLPVPGVVMDGLPGSPATNALGEYNATVSPGWSGTVTPTLMGYALNPPNRTYSTVAANFQGQDYAASVGYVVSGTVTINGGPFPDALMSSLPGNPRTDANGFYTAAVPSGWSGTVTPTVPGFTFVPPNRTYANVTANQAVQDYTVIFQGGVDDIFEENDTFATAKEIFPGTTTPLVANDEDWFKISVSAGDAGKDLKVHIKGLSCPDPAAYHDLDFYILNSSQKLMGTVMNSQDDETLYISGIAAGWYYINQHFTGQIGAVYALTVEIGNNFGIGYVSGQVTDAQGRGIGNAFVELQFYGISTDNRGPLVTTDANGNFTLGYAPGRYRILYNTNNLSSYDNSWAPNANYVGSSSEDVVTLSAGTTLTGNDAQLDEAGSISGRMTDPSGNGMALSFVYAYNSNNQQPSFAWTKPDGTYRISHLPTGNYKLRFRSSVADYANIWYDNSLTPDDALPVPVQAGSTTAGIDARLVNWTDIQGFVNGRVTDSSGNPIQGVTVAAYDSAGISVSSGRTDSAGNYGIWHLAPGPVRIFFNAGVATVSGSYASEYYPDKPTLGEAIPVLVESGQTIYGIDAQLAAAGTITGRVTDPSGNGLYGVNVAAVDINSDGVYEASTDIAGNYVRRNIPPGNYRVRFRPGSGDFAAEWYNDKTSFSDGNAITVVAGQTHTGIDAQLAANGGSITGRVTNGVAGIKDVWVYARDGVKQTVVSSARTAANGSYTVRRLPTGTAKVQFNTDLNLLGSASEYYNNMSSFETADMVQSNLGQTTTLSDGVLAAIPALTISTASLANGELGTAYNAVLQASGGRPFYYFQLESGSLPHGLMLNSKGEIQGTPTAMGTFNFTVRLTDSARPQQIHTQAFAITIGAYTGAGRQISGKVMSGGSPVPGVVMDGLPGNPATNAFGEYVATVSSGWSGTVTPMRAGYSFTPTNRVYANVSATLQNEDYTAAAGYTISGTITLGGALLPGVQMSGLPGGPRTNSSGVYTAAVPAGWSGIVAPVMPGFTFSPSNRDYNNVTAHAAGQNFAAAYAGGVDDAFESNDSFETAAVIIPGTYNDLVLTDEDWFRVFVPASDAGKILRVHIKGLTYPDPAARRDLDFCIVSGTRKLLSYNISGGDDEYAYIPDLAEGWYYIGHNYIGYVGTTYSLAVDIGTDFGLGLIEGRITDELGNGIEGVYVELYDTPFDWNVSRPLVMTRVDGTYKAYWTPGNFTVKFNLQNWNHRDPFAPDVNYISQTYNAGQIIPLAVASRVSGIDARLSPGGAVTGRVTDAEGNLLFSAVAAYGADALSYGAATTNTDGSYILDRIPTGNYKIRFRPPGGPGLGILWYEGGATFDAAVPVPVVAGQTTPNINGLYGPSGYIEGVVTNASGTPIQGVSVSAYDVSGISLGMSASTGQNGAYRLTRLPAGPLKVFFSPAVTSQNYVAEYYPDKLLIGEAGPVLVTAGGTTSGIDAQLATGGMITGRVIDAAGHGLIGISVHCMDIETERYYGAATDANGYYTINRVLPDTYRIRFRAESGDWAVEWFDDKSAFATGDPVTVGAGGHVENINARLDANGGFITGSVTAAGEVPIEGVRIFARDSVKTAVISQAFTDAAGNYSLPRLPTGQARVSFDADANYLAYITEHYNDKGTLEAGDLIATARGGTTANINAVLVPIPALVIMTTTIPPGQQFTPYNVALHGEGGRPFHYWSLAPGSDPLPAGLKLTGKGEIVGTPLATGTYNLIVRVADSTRPQKSDTQSLTLEIAQYTGTGYYISGHVYVGGAPLPGVVLEGLPGPPATNLQGEYITYVPDGYSGMARPVLAGYGFDPETDGYTDINTNRPGQDYVAYRVTLVVTTDWLPNGTEGQAYTQILGATGGTSTYTWALYSGLLPDGLTLASDGTLSGTPVKTGTYDFTVRVTDLGTPTQRVYQAYSVTINSGGLIITTPLLVWKLNEGEGTSALDSSGRGLHGRLQNGVSYTSDAAGGWGSAAETTGNGWIEKNWGGDKTFYFGNTATIMAYVKIADFDPSRFVWKLQHDRTDRGFPYAAEVALSIVGTRLTLFSRNGLLKGVEASPAFTTDIDLSDPANGFLLGAYNHLTVTIQGNQYKLFINGAEKTTGTGAPFDAGANFSCFWVMGANWSDSWLGGKLDELTVYNTALTPAQVGARYTEGPMLTISGRVTSGGAPLSGVAMNGLPGNPVTSAAGDYVGSIPPGWSGTLTPVRSGYSFEPVSRSYPNVLGPIVGEDYTAYAGGSLGITTGSLPAGWWNTPYDLTLQATSGTLPFSWSIASGRLPAGLTLDTNGRLSGTPAEAGRFLLTIRVTDSGPTLLFATRSYTLVINTEPEGLWTTTYPEGGDIYAQGLALDPADPFVIFASANNRGIFRSEDGAVHWTSNLIDSPNWPYGEICYSIFIAHQASGNLFMSTGGRILRSTDRGLTWTEIYMRNTWDIQALAVDPTNANLIYVGTQQEGIVRTTDGGTTWAAWGSGLPREEFRVIVVAPNNPGILYAGMNPSGIFVSRDAGATWTEADTGLNFDYIDDIEVHPSDPNTIYALARMSTPSYDQGIYKTTNGGLNWVKLHDAGMGWSSGGGIAIDPTNANIVYVASNQSVLKTTDGGTSWMEYTVFTANTEAIVISPRNTQVLYAGTVGEGVYKSIDGGAEWTAVNSGLRAVGFVGDSAHAIEFDKTNPNTIYAGSLNGGYRSLDRGLNWEKMGFPQWAPLALRTHPDAPGTVFGIHNSFHKSTSNGAYGTWAQTPGSPCCFPRGDIGVSTTSPLVIYFGCWGSTNPPTGVYKSIDQGQTFDLMNNESLTNTQIHSLAVHPTNTNIVFAGTLGDYPFDPVKDYGIFKTTDGGASWTHITNGLPHDLDIRQIVIFPGNPNTMYLASGGGENTGVYRSSDGGTTWTKKSGLWVDALAINPNNSNMLFAGQHNGFWISYDAGATWSDFNAGLPRNPRIDAITLDPANPNHVFIGTGAGVYEATFDFAPEIGTGSLPNATINQPYYATLYATRGTPPYAWSIEGRLPAGLSLNPTTGAISGQTADLGTYAFHARVVDNVGRSFTRGLSITVVEPSTTGMYPLAATASPPEGGTVTKNPDQSLYAAGTSVTVTSLPNPGYVLVGWSGNSLAKTSPIQILMTEPKSVSANFAASHTLPDYNIASATFPSSAAAGATIGGAVSVSVGNLGSGAMNPPALSAGIYLSNDALITPEDILLWKGRIFFAAPDSMRTTALPVDPGLQIPTTIAAGTYTIGVIVDDNDAVIERNDGNNASSRTIAISSPGYSHLEILGGWPYGSSMGVETDVSRNVALRGHGGMLEILNISDPSHPTVMSQLNFGPSQVTELRIKGNLAYIVGKALSIVDISDLHNPRVIGSCNVQSFIRDLEISGNYAFVSDYHYGLRIIDVSNPSAPTVVGSLPFDSRTRLIEASGNIVYVQRGSHIGTPAGVGGLSIVDASNPAHPVELNFLQNFIVGDMAIDKTGRYLFVYQNSGALKIYDTVNPASLLEVGSYGTGQSPGGIRIVGDRAYFTDGNQNKLIILNITDPVHPTMISSYQFQGPTSLYRPAVAGNLCLVSSWYDSLKIVDFSNESSPVERGSLETVGLSNYADVANGYAYVATNRTTSNRLKVLNLGNLPNITETASLQTSYSINDVVTSGIHAYLAGGGAGLRAVNISDPAHPTEAGSNMSAPQAQDIVISGNYAYVADGTNGFKIFDIRTPANPVLLGSCATPAGANQLSVSGRYAYVACAGQGMRIIDISDPMNPREIGSYAPGGTVYVDYVNVWENYAYVNDSYDILRIIDVSDPAHPVERATVDLYYCYGDIGFSGDYMFIPNTFFGLKVVDISNPASPVEVEVDGRFSSPVEVVVRESRICVVNRDTGFYVLELRLR